VTNFQRMRKKIPLQKFQEKILKFPREFR